MAGSSRGFAVILVALVCVDAGCQGGHSAPASIQSTQPAAVSSGEWWTAYSVEQDLQSFKRSWEEGLITKEEYERARG